jgi:hypothetical protein
VALPWEQDAAISAKLATKIIWRVVRFIYLLLGRLFELRRVESRASFVIIKNGIHIQAAPIAETSHSIPQTQCQ